MTTWEWVPSTLKLKEKIKPKIIFLISSKEKLPGKKIPLEFTKPRHTLLVTLLIHNYTYNIFIGRKEEARSLKKKNHSRIW